jgi:glutamate racemase
LKALLKRAFFLVFMKGPIGVFDSGYGGLTVLSSIREELGSYDFLYLGDNARAPYGTRSFDMVYKYTLEAVKYLFNHNCQLIILACNTASAKALRTIQQNDLPKLFPNKRVLGVLRPTTEEVGRFTNTGYVGVLGTNGTISSNSYKIEINKFFPKLSIIQKYLDDLFEKEARIDTIVLACTHYPILKEQILKYLPPGVKLLEQGDLVANKLKDYLSRHNEIDSKISKQSKLNILTTENSEKFDDHLKLFYGENLTSSKVNIY